MTTLIQFERTNKINGGFITRELAAEYVTLRLAAFVNEVCLGIEEKNGMFYASFNVWD